VQDHDVEGIDQVFVVLQPVARDDLRATATDAVVVDFEELAFFQSFQTFVARQHGFLFRWPHVGPNQSIKLLHRVPRLADFVAMHIVGRFAGALFAVTLHIEQPSVVAAPDAFILHFAVKQGRASVRAVGVDQARTSFFVPKQDQVFTQDAHFAWCGVGIAAHPDGVPVAAQ
jgi:hypothetical protein